MSTYRKIGEEARIQHCQYIGLDTLLPRPLFFKDFVSCFGCQKESRRKIEKTDSKMAEFQD